MLMKENLDALVLTILFQMLHGSVEITSVNRTGVYPDPRSISGDLW